MTRPSPPMEPCSSRSTSAEKADESGITSSLWKSFPEELLERVFTKLPFESLVRLRRVCKRWNQLIHANEIPYLENPSPKCVPVHFGRGSFSTYNSIRKDWQEQPLTFLEVDLLTSGLCLIATAGGLLCFSTYVPEKLVICNPLTRRFKEIQMPDPAVGESPFPYLYTIDRIQVAMGANMATGNYELLVAVVSECDGSGGDAANVGILRGRLLVYDSGSESWKKRADVPRDILFWLGGSVYCSGAFFCLAALLLVPEDGALWEWMLMKYDLEKDCWSVIPAIGAHVWMDHARIVEHRGSVLLITKSSSNISIYKLDESCSSLWIHLKDLPLNVFEDLRFRTRFAYRHDIWWCISKADFLFIIDPCRERSCGGLIVLVHNLSENSWDWIPMLEGNYDPHHLCAFEPSLAPP
ncbi:hypothetical protein Mapa_000141 [Marchantia paleacea]|nr:hypothetical protein Mapa_000141 [Marchantia paleacea]